MSAPPTLAWYVCKDCSDKRGHMVFFAVADIDGGLLNPACPWCKAWSIPLGKMPGRPDADWSRLVFGRRNPGGEGWFLDDEYVNSNSTLLLRMPGGAERSIRFEVEWRDGKRLPVAYMTLGGEWEARAEEAEQAARRDPDVPPVYAPLIHFDLPEDAEVRRPDPVRGWFG